MTQTEALTMSHIQREQNSITVLFFFVAKPFVVGISSIN